MRVKRYVVDNMPDAMHSIRTELGSDAVILSTKEIKTGGFMGMFKKKKIEVVAAVENEPKQAAPVKANASSTIPRSGVPTAYRRAYEAAADAGTAKTVESAPRSFAEIAAALSQESEQRGGVAVLEEKEAAPDRSRIEDAADLIKTNDQRGTSQEREITGTASEVTASFGKETASPTNEQAVLAEIKEMKQWMERLARQSPISRDLPEPLVPLRERLLDQEVDSRLADQWIDSVLDAWNDAGRMWGAEHFVESLSGIVMDFITPRIGSGIAHDTRLLYVAGPTGVGKTTTLAKLAADQMFRHGRKVGMITSDTYRISAVEQLRTYASILNVPLEVVQSPGDLQRAMSRLESCDLILMDTAGRNFRNEMLVAELQSLLAPTLKSETYLVLSLTSKTKDMKLITEHFSKYRLDKVIMTKLDETGTYGPMFNLLHDFPLSLAYVTNGQTVPDDLLMPNSAILSNLLLGAGDT
ncbi:flagellar biosynthesis protein FlhF [Paenibacillus sp. HN-1]|uniref:flagellar biosynthesis protein FlhF n=1 Tax=Paenibacillus TaxID=44249 RepID=UPI001CA8B48C|nr:MULTISPECIES: flagellar biosynthesis protein FlhF [Paenibacillus]MBY9081902.1 flagellar biosynthesis protein FlhF [Paenibacillus sp. CGMCC 1.18879]MBY9085940.1 flagellar biosynthesis protein FlhF [Paenibacillus sinensis]